VVRLSAWLGPGPVRSGRSLLSRGWPRGAAVGAARWIASAQGLAVLLCRVPRGLALAAWLDITLRRAARQVASRRRSAFRFAAWLGGGAPLRTTSERLQALGSARCPQRSHRLGRLGLGFYKPTMRGAWPWPGRLEAWRRTEQGRPGGRREVPPRPGTRSGGIVPPRSRDRRKARRKVALHASSIGLSIHSLFLVWVVKPQAEPTKAVGSLRATSGPQSLRAFARCPQRGTAAEPRGEAKRRATRRSETPSHAAKRHAAPCGEARRRARSGSSTEV
jgi:hypothetical protein